jgi:hypothetical protein
MTMNKSLVGATAIAFLVVAPTAMAQQQGTASGQPGTTSGPASGSSVEPSTQGAIGAGAPGATAGPGTQGGPSPTSSATGSIQPPDAPASPGVAAKPGTQGGASPEPASK